MPASQWKSHPSATNLPTLSASTESFITNGLTVPLIPGIFMSTRVSAVMMPFAVMSLNGFSMR